MTGVTITSPINVTAYHPECGGHAGWLPQHSYAGFQRISK